MRAAGLNDVYSALRNPWRDIAEYPAVSEFVTSNPEFNTLQGGGGKEWWRWILILMITEGIYFELRPRQASTGRDPN